MTVRLDPAHLQCQIDSLAAISEVPSSDGHSDSLLRSRPSLICVAEVCHELGPSVERMKSWAYHDSLFMARSCPATMVFIPSHGGVSHRSDEYSSPEQIRDGALVLARKMTKLTV